MSTAICEHFIRENNSVLAGPSCSGSKFGILLTKSIMVAGIFSSNSSSAAAFELNLAFSPVTTAGLSLSAIFAFAITALVIRYFKMTHRYKDACKENQRVASALLAAGDSTWRWDLDSDQVTFSPSLQSSLNDCLHPPPSNSRVWAYLLHPDDLKQTKKLMLEAQTHSPGQFQHTCRLKSKQQKYLSCIISGSVSELSCNGLPLTLTGTILFSREKALSFFTPTTNDTTLANNTTKKPLKLSGQTQRVSSDHRPPQDFERKQLLVVDDDPFIRQMLSGLLASMNVSVLLASSGEEALRMLKGHSVNLVLMDLEMPGMSGSSTLKLIRSMCEYNDLPIISMTASKQNEHFNVTHHSGFTEDILKPIDPNKLKHIIKRHLKTEVQVEDLEQQKKPKESINLEVAMHYVEGNRELLTALFNNILDDHIDDLKKFSDYQKNKDTHNAQRLLHTLKSIAGTIGATELEESCENLENQLPYQENELHKFEKAFSALMKDIEFINMSTHKASYK